MNSQLEKSGFTLTELLVVIGIFSFIIGVSFTLLTSGNLSVDISEAQIQAAENARRAIGKISTELRLSHLAYVHLYDTLQTQGSLNSGQVLYFQIPMGSYDANLALAGNYALRWGTEEANSQGDFICYFLDDDQLLRSTCSDVGLASTVSGVLVTPRISALNFSRANTSAELINIEVEGQSEAASGPVTQTLRTSIKVRN